MNGGTFIIGVVGNRLVMHGAMAYCQCAHALLNKRQAITTPAILLLSWLLYVLIETVDCFLRRAGDPLQPSRHPQPHHWDENIINYVSLTAADCCVFIIEKIIALLFLILHLISLIKRVGVGYSALIEPITCTSIQRMNSSMEAILALFCQKFYHVASTTCKWRCTTCEWWCHPKRVLISKLYVISYIG